jgi:Flp pilus assembly protein CpaB
MDNATLTVILGAIVSLVGASATVITAIWSRRKVNADARKVDADADATNTETALSMIVPMKAEMADLRKSYDAVRLELATEKIERLKEAAIMQKSISDRDNTISTMQSRISRLEGQVKMMGGDPVP